MPSEMLERMARAIWNIRREEEDRCDMELEDMGRQHPVWAEALAAMRAMREPTPIMLDAGVAYALNVSISGAGGWSAYIRAKHQHMLDAEIAAAAAGDSHDR